MKLLQSKSLALMTLGILINTCSQWQELTQPKLAIALPVAPNLVASNNGRLIGPAIDCDGDGRQNDSRVDYDGDGIERI